MSILLNANTAGLLNVANAMSGVSQPLTFCFFFKANTATIGGFSQNRVLQTTGGSGYVGARVTLDVSVKVIGGIADNGSPVSNSVSMGASLLGKWRGCVAVHTSASNRVAYTRDDTQLLSASSTTATGSSGYTGLDLLNGQFTTPTRYALLTVYGQALTSNQADEYLTTGAVAGLTPLHRWDATNSWATTLPNSGSSGLAITPPAAWVYSSDNPTFGNTAPVTVTDSITVEKGTTATTLVGGTTSVLTNDTDVDGQTLTAIVVTNPTHGALTLNSNGTFAYVHDGSSATTDSFTYKTNDGLLDGNVGTVNITITPPNSPPVVGSILLGDFQYKINTTDADGDTLTYRIVTQGTNGTASVDGTGLVTYIAGGGFTGTDVISVGISDGKDEILSTINITPPAITTPTAFSFTAQTGASLSSVVTSNNITVLGINAPSPISITGGSYSVNGGGYTTLAGTVSVNDVVTVRLTASAVGGTLSSATLSIGGVTNTFNVTTTSTVVTTPTAFNFSTQSGLAVSTPVTSNSITVLGVTAGTPISWTVTGGTASVNGGTFAASGTAQLNDAIVVKLTTSASYTTAGSATLTLGGVTGTFTATTRAAVTAPTAFSFTAVSNTALSAVSTSNTVTVLAVDGGVNIPISITGGTYSVNGGAYTSTAGNVVLNDVVTVRLTGSTSYSTSTSTTLSIGSVTGTFTATTRAAVTAPTAFSFTAQTGANIATTATSSSVTVLGVDAGVNIPISITGGTYSVNGGAYTSVAGNVLLNDVVTVRVTTSAVYSTQATATLSMGGVTGVFSTTTRAAVTAPTAFSFTAQTGVSVATPVTSESFTVAGIDGGGVTTGISIASGTYSKNGGAYTSTAGSVVLGDVITVRVTSSSSYNSPASTTLTVGGVTGTFTATTRAAVTAPTTYSFTAASSCALSTMQVSNSITVLGVDSGVTIPISITGGMYSVNGGAYTSAAGSVLLNDTVVVEVMSSSAYSNAASATLAIGGVTGTFTATTRAVDTTPSNFTFTSVSNATLSAVTTSAAITVLGVDSGVNIPISITGGTYSVNGGAYTAASGNVLLGDNVTVRVTAASVGNTITSATLTIGTIPGTFSVGTGAVITAPTAYTLVSASGVNLSTAVDSPSFTVSGVTAGVDIPITVSNGLYAVDSGSGYGAWTNVAGNVRLGYNVKTRVTTSSSYQTAATVSLNVGGVTGTFTATTRAAVTAPTAFSFSSLSGVTVSSDATSGSVTVSGVDAGIDIPISITNGMYAVNNGSGFGTFTAASGVVRLGDQVKVRVTAAGTVNTLVTASLNIGSTIGTFNVTSASLIVDIDPNVFSFTARTDVEPSTVFTSNGITVQGINSDASIAITGGTYSVNGSAYTAVAGSVSAGAIVTVRLQSSASFSTPVSATLTIGTRSATFTATTRAALTTVPSSVFALGTVVYESAPFTITGVDAGIDIPYTVSGGSISIDSGSGYAAYTSAAGNVQLGHTVKLRVIQSGGSTSTVTASAIIGGTAINFTAGGVSGSGGALTTTPSVFTFATSNGTPLNTIVQSDVITIRGLSSGVDAPITVTGCAYAVYRNNAWSSFTTVAGTVRLTDRIQLQTTSSAVSGGTVAASVTVGSYTTTWTVNSTLVVDTQPNPITFSSIINTPINSVQLSAPTVITGVDAGIDIPISVTNAEYSVDSGNGFVTWNTANDVVRLGNKVMLRLTTPGTLGAIATATINVGTTIGTWIVTNTSASNITPTAFTLPPVINAVGGQVYTTSPVSIIGVDAGIDVPFTVTGAEWSVNTGTGFTAWNTGAGTLRLNNGLELRLTASTTAGLSRGAVVKFTGYEARWSVATMAAAVVVSVPKLSAGVSSVNTSLTSALISDASLMAAQTL